MSQVEVAAIAPGTVVTVYNLFANCPARRQGLPTTTQQMKAVQGIIQQIAFVILMLLTKFGKMTKNGLPFVPHPQLDN